MASAETAGPNGLPDTTASRLVVMLAQDGDESRVCRVNAPDRVLRIWTLLNRVGDELRQVNLSPGATERLERQLEVFIAELKRSVSPALGRELRRLIPERGSDVPTTRELQVEYASLLGWTGGLVTWMVTQVQAASMRPVRPVLASGSQGPGDAPAAPGESVAAVRPDGPVPGLGAAREPGGPYL